VTNDMPEALETVSVSASRIAAFRMRRHHLDRRVPRDRLPEVVGGTCGVQTQVTVMARIALWARVHRLTSYDVERELERKRTIIKTWSMREALHLHRSSDLPVILGGLMATRLHHHQRWVAKTGLREEDTTPLVLKALEDGPMTKRELASRHSKTFGTLSRSWTDGGWGVKKEGSSLLWYLVQPAMARGLVCFGRSRGPEVTFVLMHRWLRGRFRIPNEVEAEDALLRAYLRSYGPADVLDFRRWSGMGGRRARAIVERLRDEFVEVETEGRRGFFPRRDLPDLERSDETDRGTVNLLPSFDPFLLGHYHRAHLVEQVRYGQVYKDAGWLAPVVLGGGRVAGTWHYERRSGGLDVEVEMFAPFDSETRRKVKEQAQDLARFLGVPEATARFAG
jgi:uncharacterized protein YcaQ